MFKADEESQDGTPKALNQVDPPGLQVSGRLPAREASLTRKELTLATEKLVTLGRPDPDRNSPVSSASERGLGQGPSWGWYKHTPCASRPWEWAGTGTTLAERPAHSDPAVGLGTLSLLGLGGC